MALHKSNVYLDISGWKYRYLPDEVKREIPRRLRDQFCFGTDYPMFDPEACLDELDRLELPPDVATRRPARQRRHAARAVIDEEATRARMRELADQGDLAGAIGEYARLEHQLRAELGAEPERATKRVLDELRAQAPPPLGAPHQIGRKPSEPAVAPPRGARRARERAVDVGPARAPLGDQLVEDLRRLASGSRPVRRQRHEPPPPVGGVRPRVT